MKWKILACAATAIAALAGAYILLRPKSLEPGIILIQVIKCETYMEICKSMRDFFTTKYQKKLKKYRNLRRTLPSSSLEYEKCVLEFNQKTKKIVEKAQNSILHSYSILKKTFEDSVNYYDSDPLLQPYANDIVNTSIPIDAKKILSKDLAKEILDYFQNRLKEYESDCPDLEEYMIINTQIEDEIFNVYGIEIEILTGSWEVYKKELEELYEPLRNQTYCVLASTDNSF